MIGDDAAAHAAIQQLVLGFAHRDRGEWEKLRALFAPDATIAVSWYAGPIAGFIERSAAMAAAGGSAANHLLFPPRIVLAGDRAVADSDVVIMVRLHADEGDVDLTSWARFHDLVERIDGRWRIRRRAAIYDRDRLDPVAGAIALPDLSAYPLAYRHMAYVLSRVGRGVAGDPPVTGGAGEAALIAEGERWLGSAYRGFVARMDATIPKSSK